MKTHSTVLPRRANLVEVATASVFLSVALGLNLSAEPETAEPKKGEQAPLPIIESEKAKELAATLKRISGAIALVKDPIQEAKEKMATLVKTANQAGAGGPAGEKRTLEEIQAALTAFLKASGDMILVGEEIVGLEPKIKENSNNLSGLFTDATSKLKDIVKDMEKELKEISTDPDLTAEVREMLMKPLQSQVTNINGLSNTLFKQWSDDAAKAAEQVMGQIPTIKRQVSVLRKVKNAAEVVLVIVRERDTLQGFLFDLNKYSEEWKKLMQEFENLLKVLDKLQQNVDPHYKQPESSVGSVGKSSVLQFS